MIVEDEYGNDIDLHDLADEREPEPPDDWNQALPADLDEIDRHYHQALAEDMSGIPEHSLCALAAVPQLLADLRHAHAAVRRWHGMKVTAARYAITSDGEAPGVYRPAIPLTVVQADEAAALAEQGRGPAPWVNTTYDSGWHKHERPPF